MERDLGAELHYFLQTAFMSSFVNYARPVVIFCSVIMFCPVINPGPVI